MFELQNKYSTDSNTTTTEMLMATSVSDDTPSSSSGKLFIFILEKMIFYPYVYHLPESYAISWAYAPTHNSRMQKFSYLNDYCPFCLHFHDFVTYFSVSDETYNNFVQQRREHHHPSTELDNNTTTNHQSNTVVSEPIEILHNQRMAVSVNNHGLS